MPPADPALLRLPLADLPDPLPIPTLAHPFHLTLRPPGSKSLTNRALLLAALADGTSTLRHALTEADDAQRMLAAIEQLGARVERPHPDLDNTLRVTGVNARFPIDRPADLFLNNAGTATRFLAAAALLARAPVTIDGNARMRERPIGELADALRALGARVTHTRADGYPPIVVSAPAWIADPANHRPPHPHDGDPLHIARTQSSQFVSALLLIAPFLPGGLALRLSHPTSPSYIRMTLALLRNTGAALESADDLSVIRIPPQPFRALDLEIEPDASSATYFWAAAAVTPGAACTIQGLHPPHTPANLQGDADFPALLAQMGARLGAPGNGQWAVGNGAESTPTVDPASPSSPLPIAHSPLPPSPPSSSLLAPARLRPLNADMTDMPDAAMTLAVCCAISGGRSVLRGVRTLRVKETDRIAALRNELAKVGVAVEEDLDGNPDALAIHAPEGGIDCSRNAPPVSFRTYDDHRMAMALSILALRRPNCVIEDPRCVAKTYPSFFSDLAAIFSVAGPDANDRS